MTPYATDTGWTLFLGDVLEVLPEVRRLGFVPTSLVTDPPFATAGGNTNGRDSAADDQYWAFWFRAVFAEIAETLPPSACGFVFCDHRMLGALSRAVSGGIDRQTPKGWAMSQALVWDRESIGLGKPFRASFEMIGFVRGPTWEHDPGIIPRNVGTVIHHRFPYGVHEYHGAEKPVDLCRQLVRWAGGSGVLDPFCGSGSVGVAARNEGRTYVGIERDERTLEIAARRLAQAEANGVQAPLFAPAGVAP